LQVSTSHAGLPFSYKQSTKRRNTTGNAQNERALNEDTQLKSVLAHSFTTEHDLISDEKEMIQDVLTPSQLFTFRADYCFLQYHKQEEGKGSLVIWLSVHTFNQFKV
jgi:hypothetical protein